jgi:hypothetical protein
MVWEPIPDDIGSYLLNGGFRCANCGEFIDEVIAKNREKQHGSKSSQ